MTEASNTGVKASEVKKEYGAYHEFLEKLPLMSHHARDLAERVNVLGGKSNLVNELAAVGYSSWTRASDHNCKEAVKNLYDNGWFKVPVPGFWEEKGTWKMIFPGGGMFIPVRDVNGQIVNIIMRRDNTDDPTAKYATLSSGKKHGGANAIIKTHCPVINKDKATSRIRVTEGPMKADIASLLGDKYCIGLNGVGYLPKDFRSVLRALEVSEIEICMDAELSRETAMGIVRLMDLAKKMEIDCVVMTWDRAYKGLDDILAAEGENAVRQMTDIELSAIESIAGRGWCFVTERNKYFEISGRLKNIETGAVARSLGVSERDVKDMSAERSDGERIIRVVDNVGFRPGEDRFFTDNEDKECLNLWRDPCISPLEPKTDEHHALLETVLNHFKILFPTEGGDIFLGWIRTLACEPKQKLRWALLVYGEHQQTGKSTIFEQLVMPLVGRSNCTKVSSDALSEHFTGWASGNKLVVVDEVDHSEHYKTVNKLKSYITDDDVSVRMMRKDEFMTENHVNIAMMSNFGDAMAIKQDDERFCVINTPVSKEYVLEHYGQDYFTKLRKALAHPDTVKLFLWYLEGMDVEFMRDNITGTPPMTDAKRAMIDVNKSAFDYWIEQKHRDEEGPLRFPMVSIGELMVLARDDRGGKFAYEKQISNRVLGPKLRELGWVKKEFRCPGTNLSVYVRPEELERIKNEGLKSNEVIAMFSRDYSLLGQSEGPFEKY